MPDRASSVKDSSFRAGMGSWRVQARWNHVNVQPMAMLTFKKMAEYRFSPSWSHGSLARSGQWSRDRPHLPSGPAGRSQVRWQRVQYVVQAGCDESMWICLGVCIVYKFIWLWICIPTVHRHTCRYMHTHSCITYIYIHVCVCVHIHTCTVKCVIT